MQKYFCTQEGADHHEIRYAETKPETFVEGSDNRKDEAGNQTQNESTLRQKRDGTGPGRQKGSVQQDIQKSDVFDLGSFQIQITANEKSREMTPVQESFLGFFHLRIIL